MTIKEILKDVEKLHDSTIKIKGWTLSNRGNKKIKFITINDGSTFANLQIVAKEGSKIDLEIVDQVRMGASVLVKGKILHTPNGKQIAEMVAEEFEILKNTDEDFPLQKNGMSKEVLREIPHLRHRTNLFRAVMRIRSTLSQELHAHFASKGYLLAVSPIITGNDGEGAGEAFVTDDESKDLFFGKKATLGVTGQLHAEAYANGFGGVYTFAPTFRAENSNTQRHAAEFWMIEPEVAFADLQDILGIADDLLKTIITKTIEKHPEEFAFLEKFVAPGLMEKLSLFLEQNLKVMDYSDAIIELKKVADRFEEKNIEFGIDLATEHEKYLAEELHNAPVAVINYPKDIKAFYMHQNDDGKTVAAFDLLVPGVGELIGGSQRECDYDKLVTRINEMGIDQEDLQWYLDLRRFGQSMSSGFGLGFERLVMYVTGVENIRDAIPFPRTPGKLMM
ncbi:asparagine--tRNA ligase [Mycoplasma marinum]|uniref:Asparagine--tRNA ligase n=1 Tax=Mycoplasma marinum TaxID=1937190 RepID=A0A4R0XUP2_9MOLU|nr:asparagine--tRNA ligase [Mycoplasma marinum]TCG11527.1 asparagine--tRNA ligase [Mycoplasma marinum]